MSIQTIDMLSLSSVTGGKARSTKRSTTPTTTQPAEKPNLGGDLLKGCFSGASGSIKQGAKVEDIASGCAIGAGKSLIEGLGKVFGK